MNRMVSTSLQFLWFLEENGNTQHLETILLSPYFAFWGHEGRVAFERDMAGLRNLLSSKSQILRLLELHLITEALLSPRNAPQWYVDCLMDNLNVDDLFPGLEGRIFHGHWQPVPVFLVLGKCHIRYFVAGVLGGSADAASWPPWAGDLMDEKCRKAIKNTVKTSTTLAPLSPDQRLYCYPLAPASNMVQFRGASLGLPLALAFLTLLDGEKMPRHLAASGSLTEDGGIAGVGNLPGKMQKAKEEGFKTFLFPKPSPNPGYIGSIELVPVENLAQAWMLSHLCAMDGIDNPAKFGGLLDDPVHFVNMCASVPAQWLLWVKGKGLTTGLVNQIWESPALLKDFVGKIDACLGRGDLELGETLAGLMEPDEIGKRCDRSPFSMFKLLTLLLAMATHRGDLDGSNALEKEIGAMVQKASATDLSGYAELENRRYIALNHNRYSFDPRVPKHIESLVIHLTRRFQEDRECFGGKCSKALGALHGTLAQNFGFCGPEQLSNLEDACRLSLEAFGMGEIPEQREDWLRPFGYLTYAYLDASDFKKAEEALLSYLEAGNWMEIPDRIVGFTKWQHSLLARFLVDAKHPFEKDYFQMVKESVKPGNNAEHPWQLWTWNMGRIAISLRKVEPATEYFSKSIQLCLHPKNGPTIQVMALLPMSGLREPRQKSRIPLETVEKAVRQAAKELNPKHFRILEDKKFEEVLATVWEHPERLFPFSYR